MNDVSTLEHPGNAAPDTTGANGLSVVSIAKSYDRRVVLSDVSISVARGEVLGLLGPNGAGKTTCFYSIMGLVKPDSGRILLDGEDITGLPMYRRAVLGLGYLPQETSIFRGLTVAQNIMSVLELAEPDKTVRRARLDQLLGEFHLDGLRDSMATALSGGERRRCEIARALAANPSIMLLDEPFAGIDPISIADIRDLICQLKKRGIGVLITDHNVRETLDIVDRACIIYDGRVLFAGSPADLVADENVRRLYLGDSFELLTMGLGPRLDLRQSQSLVMTPQLQQAIKLLALSNLEVEAFIAEEIEKNPLLEGGAGDEAPDAPNETDPAAAAEAPAEATLDAPAADDADWSEERFEASGASDGGGAGNAGDSEGIDFDGFASAADTLTEHLMHQAGERLDGVDLAIAAQIVDAIDDAGYLTVTVAELAGRIGVARARIEGVLAIVQQFDPAGVGARSLAECLAIQAREADRYDPCMALLIDNLDLLAGGRIAQLQRRCGVDDEDMADMIRELRGYDPKPGLRFGTAPVEAVTPDLFVTETAKGWRVEINGATLPRVLIDRKYHAELARGANDKASKLWLSECLASANWLVKALDQRQRTIVKVASAIVTAQEGFFRQGVAQLRPLTLRAIAEAVEMHELTVSRVTSNKYLSCARGTFELKYFFTSAIQSADGSGEGASALAVKAAIKLLIAGEEAHAILSDDTLVDLLREKGFDIARRTVAKYREALGLGSSVQRRRARAIDTKAA